MTTATRDPDFVYKIVTADVFAASRAAGRCVGMPIDIKDGYIHFSSAAQLAETLRLHFAGQGDLVLFAVRAADLGEGLRWEPSRGGQLFPHHYGELLTSAIARSAPIAVASDGAMDLPAWAR